jgi:hypothetical protein
VNEQMPVEPAMWTVRQIDALHSLREALGMPTPSDPLAVLEMALFEVIANDEIEWADDDPRWQR